MAILDNGHFDPTTAASGQVRNQLPAWVGTLVVFNDSGWSLQFSWNGTRKKRILAQTIDILRIKEPAELINWQQSVSLTNLNALPLSQIQIDAYTPDEPLPYGRYPVSLSRIMYS